MLAGSLVFGLSWHYFQGELDNLANAQLSGTIALHLWGRVRQGGMMAGEKELRLLGSVAIKATRESHPGLHLGDPLGCLVCCCCRFDAAQPGGAQSAAPVRCNRYH